ncbi:MAG: SDR family NAD(P)-dependent oxidoreductase [Novosphingobium sp.]|nr:SDR family NAD(P)-dependent oxidoreductase [Novosphingobium sp.]
MSKARNWFITGANRGLGAAIARAAVAAGDNVVVTGRNLDGLKSAFPGNGNQIRAVQLDVTNDSEIETAVAAGVDAFGTIDVLVNNAGYGLLGVFENMTDAQIRHQYDVNVFGAMSVTRAILPIMRQQRSGHIFTISSIGGLRSSSGGSVYCSSKFAVEGWMEGLNEELSPLGIHAILIEPGYFRTDFFDPSSAMYDHHDIPDYAEFARESREFRQGMNHKQVGDPDKLGTLMVGLLDMKEPPVRIAAGSDASQWAEEKGHILAEQAAKWRHISVTTDGKDGIAVN